MNAYTTFRALGAAAMLAVAAACSENGTGPITEPPLPPDIVDARPNHVPPATMFDSMYVEAIVTCNVTRSPATIACGSPQAPAGGASPVGGKGTHVRLFTSGASYNSGTSVWQAGVAIRNLLINRIGTPDGTTQTGLFAFLTQNPTVTGGTGTVTVNNADSLGTFTAPNQRYFFYDTLLALNQNTVSRLWRFNVPATVSSFQFKVYVSTPKLPVIVFDKVVGGNREIFRVALDGSDLFQLTATAGDDMDPTVANGRVVFVTYRNGNADLYSVGLQGGAQTPLVQTPNVNETAPALSLNGQYLAYVSDVAGVTKLWIADADGTDRAPVTGAFSQLNAIENSPSWDRSQRVAFTTTRGSTADVFFHVIGGGDPTPFPGNSATAQDVELAFSHNGTRFTWSTDRDGDTEVYWRETNTVRLTNHVGMDASPSFLSDGKILYWVDAATPFLEWRNPVGAEVGTVPTGAGAVGNPYGMPLWQ